MKKLQVFKLFEALTRAQVARTQQEQDIACAMGEEALAAFFKLLVAEAVTDAKTQTVAITKDSNLSND